jgi:hypothetical protein
MGAGLKELAKIERELAGFAPGGTPFETGGDDKLFHARRAKEPDGWPVTRFGPLLLRQPPDNHGGLTMPTARGNRFGFLFAQPAFDKVHTLRFNSSRSALQSSSTTNSMTGFSQGKRT